MFSHRWLKDRIRLKSLLETCLSLKVHLRNKSGKQKMGPAQTVLVIPFVKLFYTGRD